MNRAIVRGDARHVHHARMGRLPEQCKQVCSEREVAKKVGAELKLESIGGQPPSGGSHHTGVIEQDIDARLLIAQARPEIRDGLQTTQIEELESDGCLWHMLTDVRDGLAAFRLVCDPRRSRSRRPARVQARTRNQGRPRRSRSPFDRPAMGYSTWSICSQAPPMLPDRAMVGWITEYLQPRSAAPNLYGRHAAAYELDEHGWTCSRDA